ncbi:MAG: hypothetical protein GVY17_10035 [Cyanobacteria bacterium]|jgi:Ca-activated chloride channel family protein|nr:hypothetical protein [Cyanobacteria bacterium GSL.Bin21]
MKTILNSIKENYSKGLQFGGWGAFGGGIGSLLSELTRSEPSTSLIGAILSTGIWFAIIGGTIALFLLMGYSSYLKRGWRIGESSKKGILPGVLAGLVAGAIAQFIYTIVGPTEVLRVICWGVAGGLLGFGLSFRIPNLGKVRGFFGGGVGGIIGGILFIFITLFLGEVMGRLLGISAIGFFIGVMIILVEAVFRSAWLVVKWSANEEKTLSLGSEPILLGCADHAHIYLRQDQGYAPVTAKVYMEKNKVLMQYDSKYGEEKGMKKLTHELQNGDKRKLGSVSLEVKSTKS